VIDVHAHVVLEGLMGAAGEYGPEMRECDGHPSFRVGEYVLDGVRYRGTAFLDVDVRLAAMERRGVTFQVLSPNPLTYLHHAPVEIAAPFCRRHNDLLAELVRAHPRRLGGLAALPAQDPQAAVTELERAVRELGLLGGAMGTEPGAALLDDPALDELYAACVGLDVPLFLHPAPSGIDGPLRDARLRRFDLDLVLGFAAEESLAVATLVYGGVLDRHPGLDLCLSHGGGATPFLAGRMRQAARLRSWSSPGLREEGGFDARLRRLWFDAHVHDPRSLQLLVDVAGADRLVAGTNFAGWDEGAVPQDGSWLDQLDGNARRLLRLPTGFP
jgi:aminocarboxymuconate-semialdehyde decarboxylase